MRTFNRRSGVIPNLKRQAKIDTVIYFDTETTQRKTGDKSSVLEMRLGWMIVNRFDKKMNVLEASAKYFTDGAQFVRWLSFYLLPGKTTYVIAHNIQFDIQVLDLMALLVAAGFDTELPIISNWLFMWTTHYEKSTVIFLDSLNIFQVSLKQLGDNFELHKLGSPDGDSSDSDVSRYCYRDVEILETAFHHYFNYLTRHQLGYFAYSLAWQSMVAYRTRFMNKSICIHTNYDVLKLERAGFHGGRSECFFIGRPPESTYALLDVNSMYPHIMKTQPMPVEFLERFGAPTLKTLKNLLLGNYCIARVKLRTDQPVYPLMHKGKLLFPTGEFEAVLHHKELEYALSANHIKGVSEVACYRSDFIFADYVDFFYGEKTQAQAAGDLTHLALSKLFLNAFFGKWAQVQTITECLGKSPIPGVLTYDLRDIDTGHRFSEFHWFGKRYLVARIGEKPYTSPAIAGAITAGARMYLWESMLQAGRGNVLYCDTDSMILSEQGLLNMSGQVSPSALGKWKLAQLSDFVAIYGAKDYAFGLTIKFKGLKEGSVKIGDNEWTVTQFRGLKKAIKEGETGKMRINDISRHRTAAYGKGVVRKDGWVDPFWMKRQ